MESLLEFWSVIFDDQGKAYPVTDGPITSAISATIVLTELGMFSTSTVTLPGSDRRAPLCLNPDVLIEVVQPGLAGGDRDRGTLMFGYATKGEQDIAEDGTHVIVLTIEPITSELLWYNTRRGWVAQDWLSVSPSRSPRSTRSGTPTSPARNGAEQPSGVGVAQSRHAPGRVPRDREAVRRLRADGDRSDDGWPQRCPRQPGTDAGDGRVRCRTDRLADECERGAAVRVAERGDEADRDDPAHPRRCDEPLNVPSRSVAEQHGHRRQPRALVADHQRSDLSRLWLARQRPRFRLPRIRPRQLPDHRSRRRPTQSEHL